MDLADSSFYPVPSLVKKKKANSDRRYSPRVGVLSEPQSTRVREFERSDPDVGNISFSFLLPPPSAMEEAFQCAPPNPVGGIPDQAPLSILLLFSDHRTIIMLYRFLTHWRIRLSAIIVRSLPPLAPRTIRGAVVLVLTLLIPRRWKNNVIPRENSIIYFSSFCQQLSFLPPLRPVYGSSGSLAYHQILWSEGGSRDLRSAFDYSSFHCAQNCPWTPLGVWIDN